MFMEDLPVGSQIVISKNDISMKKIFFYFVLLAATVIATASCSKEEPAQTETTQTGMVLHATVDQTVATRATLSDGDTWTFAFSQNDAVFVRNDEMSPDKHWMFTKGDDDFSCISAETTESATNWYAYFPQVIVYLFQQSGKKEDVAKYLYALSGSTASPTTGEDGLSIAMAPQVAILVIDNQKGPIDINVKTDKYSWVHSLKAKTGSAGFDLVTEETKVSLLTTDTPGTYYIAVPAGVQLCIKDGDTEIKSTITDGFTAGKYYEITVIPEGALSGRFTINEEGDQVYFSKGNLWRDNDGLFHFEDNQYDFNRGDYDTEHISHFMWSKDIDVACALIYDDPSASQNDVFFTNADETTPNPDFTVNGQKEVWRTLSKDEWEYLIENNGSVWATINGIGGLIIFCDGYSGSTTDLTGIPHGCAFLPATGIRNGDGGNPSVVSVGTDGYYWSASPDGPISAFDLFFHSSNVNPDHPDIRDYAYAVRLVTDVK